MEKINPEIRREVANQINYLGDSELALGYSRAQIKTVASVVEEIQKHRKQFEDGKVTSIGSAAFASTQQWEALAAESERAARDILLGDSSLLSEVDELARKATEAKRLADEKNRELQSLWSDFRSIPEKEDRINAKLGNLRAERAGLAVEKLNTDFKELYGKILQGALVDHMALAYQATVIATRNLRLDVIAQLEGELNAQLAELKTRTKALARRLGQKSSL
jgi:hypothetical protein